jgi:transcriptional regulator
MVEKSINMLDLFKKIKKELKVTLEKTESILSI